jgi:hypothetical protein
VTDSSQRVHGGPGIPGAGKELVAARRRDQPHGPAATRLWRFIAEPPGLRAAVTDSD